MLSADIIRRRIVPLWAWAVLLPLASVALLNLLLPSLFQTFSLSLLDRHLQHQTTGSVISNRTDTTAVMSGSFLEAVRDRRTVYALDKTLPIGSDKVTEMVKAALQAVPTSFNSQSNRAVLLFGDDHLKLWEIVTDVLKARVSEEKWPLTEQKTEGFKAAAGTVLFFVDQSVVDSYATNIPTYAASFQVWAAQADAMLQHTIWTALSAEGVGANLQHYNPLIDEKVTQAWKLPLSWKLTAQFVFGGIAGDKSSPPEMKPIEEKFQVHGL